VAFILFALERDEGVLLCMELWRVSLEGLEDARERFGVE
jgi:hypothetical protein